MNAPYFTVFTPTYNRGGTLGGVYESLKSQTFRSFEWLIVDDGSNDDTRNRIKLWQHEENFPIRYIYQENKGKHFASNVGVKEAKGVLFLFLDSDDTCFPETLEQFKLLWESIPENGRERYSTISVLCIDSKGNVVGEKFPADVIDVESGWHQYKLRSSGERFGINRTEILRSFPFPEFKNEKFIPESIVWNRMALHYKTKFVNRALRVYEQRTDSLSVSSLKIRVNSPLGASTYYNELNYFSLPILEIFKAAVNYVRFSFHSNTSVNDLIRKAISPVPTLLSLGIGFIIYKYDQYNP